MTTAQLLLIYMGVFVAVMMVPAVIFPTKVRKIMMEFVGDTKIMRVMGMISMMIGFLFLSVHYKFTEGWLMTISILGWMSVIKGVGLMWCPEMAIKLYKKYYNSDKFFIAAGILMGLLCIGLICIAIYPLAPTIVYFY